MKLPKPWVALIFAQVCGCAANPPKLTDLKTGSAELRERVMAVSPGDRRHAYDENRLTWEGKSISVGKRWVARAELDDYLRQVGALDLAEKLPAAKAGISLGDRPNPPPNFGDRGAGDRPSAAWEWLNLFRIFEHTGGQSGAPPELAVGLAIGVAAVGAAGAGLIGTVATTVSLLDGISTELETAPTLEALLESYNQRLAYSMGLDHTSTALTTSMPRPGSMFQYNARDQRRLRTLIRTGLSASVATMGIASAAAGWNWAQDRNAPPWGGTAFGAALGALVVNFIIGANFVW